MNTTTDAIRYHATDALGHVIREQGRHKRWLSQRVGVHESQIGKIVSGKRTATEEVATKIAQSLDVPVFVLFETRSRVDSTHPHGDTQ